MAEIVETTQNVSIIEKALPIYLYCINFALLFDIF